MKKESENRMNSPRISSVMKTITFVLVLFVATGLLSISIGPNAVSKTDILNGESALAGDSLPTLVDLGSEKCMPCRMLAPVIAEIKDETAGRLTVVYHDVWKDPAPAREYGIYGIPTLIFLDENGKEIFRHMGYWSKEAILDKWKELGYDLR
jgi:thioredoxin 1